MKKIQNLHLIYTLKRRLLWVLLFGLLVGTANFFYIRSIPDTYESEATVVVEALEASKDNMRRTENSATLNDLPTIAQKFMSQARLEEIISKNNLYTAQRRSMPMEQVVKAMRKDITLKVTGIDTFRLSYKTHDPHLAQKITHEIASLFAEENSNGLEELASSFEGDKKRKPFRILNPASFPEKPSKPDRVTLNLLGLVVGLSIGFGLAIVLELKEESVRTESELVRLTNLPILASIPIIPTPKLESSVDSSSKIS